MNDFLHMSEAEINDICKPLVLPAAQCRYLRRLGLHVEQKPNGHALVAKSEFERVLGASRLTDAGQQVSADVAALRARWRNKNGPQTQKR